MRVAHAGQQVDAGRARSALFAAGCCALLLHIVRHFNDSVSTALGQLAAASSFSGFDTGEPWIWAS